MMNRMLSTPQGPAPVTDLPGRLRAGTRDLHTLSERSGVMASLIAGRLARADYVALMCNLHAIYAALEAALKRHADEPALAVLGTNALHREAALAGDLDVLCGPRWRATQPLATATLAYVVRLQARADKAPHLLVAHAYVRYLGDLHGGQMLKRLVARSLAAGDFATAGVASAGVSAGASAGGPPLDATRFYEFGSDDEVLALRQAFRSGLARIAVDTATANRLVAEARWAFQQHVALFNELAPAARPDPQPVARASA